MGVLCIWSSHQLLRTTILHSLTQSRSPYRAIPRCFTLRLHCLLSPLQVSYSLTEANYKCTTSSLCSFIVESPLLPYCPIQQHPILSKCKPRCCFSFLSLSPLLLSSSTFLAVNWFSICLIIYVLI